MFWRNAARHNGRYYNSSNKFYERKGGRDSGGGREREREEKIYCDGFVHANLFSENWPLKRCGARGDNIVVALIASERKEDQSARDEGFDSQIHAPPPFTLTDLLQNAE